MRFHFKLIEIVYFQEIPRGNIFVFWMQHFAVYFSKHTYNQNTSKTISNVNHFVLSLINATIDFELLPCRIQINGIRQ